MPVIYMPKREVHETVNHITHEIRVDTDNISNAIRSESERNRVLEEKKLELQDRVDISKKEYLELLEKEKDLKMYQELFRKVFQSSHSLEELLNAKSFYVSEWDSPTNFTYKVGYVFELERKV